MVVNAHLDQYDGLRVVNFGSGDAPEPGERVAWAVRLGMDRDPREDLFDQAFGRFLDSVDTASVTHLVIGFWDTDCMADSSDVQQLLADAAPRLPNLKALFFGDATFEESEISWMEQSDLSALLAAYPDLERLDVRGGTGLRLPSLSGSSLRQVPVARATVPLRHVKQIQLMVLENSLANVFGEGWMN